MFVRDKEIVIGDIIVSTVNLGRMRKVGDMFKVLRIGNGCFYYRIGTNSTQSHTWRPANSIEISDYRRGKRNISDVINNLSIDNYSIL